MSFAQLKSMYVHEWVKVLSTDVELQMNLKNRWIHKYGISE